jgi:DNA-binding response OmpR family regulator
MMPGMDGLEVCKVLSANKETKNIPIVMLTAKSSEVDQVVGLEIGAADYVSKPFSVKVLLAKIKKMIRKPQTSSEEEVLKAGDFILDKARMTFTIKGKPITLTKIEFRILAFLMANRGKVFSRDKLLSGAWDGETFVVDRTVDVHVKSLRQKLGKYRGRIETVRGTGYRFAEEAD